MEFGKKELRVTRSWKEENPPGDVVATRAAKWQECERFIRSVWIRCLLLRHRSSISIHILYLSTNTKKYPGSSKSTDSTKRKKLQVLKCSSVESKTESSN